MGLDVYDHAICVLVYYSEFEHWKSVKQYLQKYKHKY